MTLFHRFRNRRMPWLDPKVGYRNDPEYQRQRAIAKLTGEEDAVEQRWAARWQQKLAMQGQKGRN
jgi:hypothetical protein